MTQQINLFNPAFLKQKKIFTVTTMLRSLAVLLVGALALVFYGNRATAELQARADAGVAELAKKKAIQQQVLLEFAPRKKSAALESQITAIEAQQASLKHVIEVLQGGALGNTEGYSPYFSALARQSMADLWLTGVSIAGAGAQIGLRGRALDPGLVPAYISRLTREPVMQGKGFGQLKISRAALGTVGTGGAKGVELAPFIDFDLRSETIETALVPAPAAVSPPAPAGPSPALQNLLNSTGAIAK